MDKVKQKKNQTKPKNGDEGSKWLVIWNLRQQKYNWGLCIVSVSYTIWQNVKNHKHSMSYEAIQNRKLSISI